MLLLEDECGLDGNSSRAVGLNQNTLLEEVLLQLERTITIFGIDEEGCAETAHSGNG